MRHVKRFAWAIPAATAIALGLARAAEATGGIKSR